MKIEISVFSICIIVFVLNTILDHLFNWWFRNIEPNEEKSTSAFLLLYITKATLIISGLYQITR